MNAVEFRVNAGVLEYRSLIIRERDVYRDGDPCGEELWIDYKNQYTDWMPVAIPVKAGDPTCRTEIPWNRVSVRCRKWLRDAVESNRFGDFNGHKWPLCCEDLMSIGFERLVNGIYVRNWGRKSAEEIIPLMAELGFTGWEST
jgi:hypothetical protein